MSIGITNEVANAIAHEFGPTTSFQQAGGSDRRTGILNPSFVPHGKEGLANLDLAEQRWGFPRPRVNPDGDRWHATVAYSETQQGVFVAACEAAWRDGWFEARLGIPKSHAQGGIDRSAKGSPDWLERTDLAMTKAGEEILEKYGKVEDGGATKPFKPLPPGDQGSRLSEMLDETKHPFWARSPKWDKPEAKGYEDLIWERQWEWLERMQADGHNVDELSPNSYGPGFQPTRLLEMKKRLDELEAMVKEGGKARDAGTPSGREDSTTAPDTAAALAAVKVKLADLSAAVDLLSGMR